MMRTSLSVLHCQVVEEEVEMTLSQLCQASDAELDLVQQLVAHGVLEPRSDVAQGWVFAGTSLRRTRVAVRLMRDLELNLPGAALAVDLLEQIATLQRDLLAASGAYQSRGSSR